MQNIHAIAELLKLNPPEGLRQIFLRPSTGYLCVRSPENAPKGAVPLYDVAPKTGQLALTTEGRERGFLEIA